MYREVVLGGILLATLALSSCSENKLPFDRQVFHYNQASGISSLDPAFARDQASIWACTQLYTGLVQLDHYLAIRPAIASRWDISSDGLVYTFHLRSDVYFHHDTSITGSTRRVKASDVVYSLQRVNDPHTASPGAWIFHGRVDTVQPFLAIDDTTFRLRLLAPFPPMLGILTMPYCSVVPHEAVAYYGLDFRSHPVGTGPFRFTIWKEGVALILAKSHNYYEQDNDGTPLPHIEGVRVSFMNSKKTEFVAFKQGRLDFISGLDASFMDEALDERGELSSALASSITLTKSPYLNTEYLGFNMHGDSTSALHQRYVRQAINYGFDRRELIRYLRNNIGRAAESGFTPVGLPSYDSTIIGYSYQPERAKALLLRAGYSDAHPLPPITLYTNETYKEIALMLSKQLDKIGIRLQVEVTEPAILREWMSGGKVAFFRGSWIADYPDAESYFTVFYSKNSSPPNYTRFNDPRYDALYEQSLTETDDSARYQLYHSLERIIIDQAPIVPLYYDEVLHFTQKRVKGLENNGLNLLDLKRVRLE